MHDNMLALFTVVDVLDFQLAGDLEKQDFLVLFWFGFGFNAILYQVY